MPEPGAAATVQVVVWGRRPFVVTGYGFFTAWLLLLALRKAGVQTGILLPLQWQAGAALMAERKRKSSMAGVVHASGSIGRSFINQRLLVCPPHHAFPSLLSA